MLGYFAVAVSTFLVSVLSFALSDSPDRVIHLLHNPLKTALLWKKIDWIVVAKFGSVD